jgi:hypothetical protein
MSTPEALFEALREERRAALDEASFERGRAAQALERNERLRTELASLRERLKDALGGRTAEPDDEDDPTPSRGERDLSERLRLAMDTNWRLERDRSRLEKKLHESRELLGEERERVGRLERKVLALEGELRLRD